MPQRILIVDDTLFMRVTLKNILVNEGYHEIFQAENGKEAVEKAASLRPNLILMDITMPVMDGIAATRAIRADNPETLIVMCTAMGQKNVVIDAIRAGAKDFIVKPFHNAKVIESVQKLIGAAVGASGAADHK
jgi:two-component system chemotaxis response regulator CheY